MKWLNLWASGIVIAVIVTTLIETLLPEGNNKKYIKIILGLYILFTMFSPLISKISDIDIISLVKNVGEYEHKYKSEYFEGNEDINTDEIIKNTYIGSIKEDIETRLLRKGYQANEVIINTEKDEQNYLKIKKIDLNISKIKYKTKDKYKDNIDNGKDSVKNIEEVSVNISKSTNKKEKLLVEEIIEIKKYLAETYEIEEEAISIL